MKQTRNREEGAAAQAASFILEGIDSRTKGARRTRHLVLWDGECSFCRRCVIWLRRHDLFGALEFCPFQEAELDPELRAACARALHVITRRGQVLRAGRAVLFCGRFTRFHRLARLGEWPIFLSGIEIGYAHVARHRTFWGRVLFRA